MRTFLSCLLLVAFAGLAAACASPQADEPAGPPDDGVAALPERDHERVREAVARGEMVPLAGILADAQRRYPGTVLEVELEGDEYEVEILGADGVIMEFEYDVRTGELLEAEVEN